MRLRFQITHYAPSRPERASGPVFSKTELGNLRPNAPDRCFATRTSRLLHQVAIRPSPAPFPSSQIIVVV